MGEEIKTSITVNGETVEESLIQQELQMLRERYSREMSWQEMDEKQAKIESDARENAVERILLMQKARAEINGVRPEEIEARFLVLKNRHGGEKEFAQRFELSEDDLAKIKADIEDGIKLEKLFELICADVPHPGEADARNYFDENPAEFTVPEMVHAAHIVQHPNPGQPVEKIYSALLNLRERLLAGEDFDQLAGEFSHCRDGEHDLGFFTRGQMVQSFENAAFRTPPGKYSDVIQTEFGYHIIKVIDRKPETMRDFADVRYDIENMLLDERKNEAIGAVADELRAKADIKNLMVVEG